MTTENTENLAYIDDLTGFFNRRYLNEQLPLELASAREKKQEFLVIMLDIDHFKTINDTYGHLSGDQLIKDVSAVLKNSTKSGDKRIRYGGDEFTIILPNAEAKNTPLIAERIVKKVETTLFKEITSGKEIHITISMGIAAFPRDSHDPIELIKLADKSLYVSKRKGRNCFSTVSEITTELIWKEYIFERFPCHVFVDREKELSILNTALKETFKSQGSFILITGESGTGIGKTRLLNEFEKSAKAQDTICLSSRCADKFMAQPYYSITNILNNYLYSLNKLPPEFLKDIPDTGIHTLFNLIPALKDIAPNIGQKSAETEEKTDPWETLSKFILNISTYKPVCLFMDELHYIDAQSIDVISGLFQQNKELPILFTAAFSQDKLSSAGASDFPFNHFMKENIPEDSRKKHIINLSKFNFAETKIMASSIFHDVPLTDNFFKIIYKTTGGNPLFIEELLKYLIAKEYILFNNGKWEQKEIMEADLPVSVEKTIEARLEELNPETKEMITKAAVIGEDFQIDLLGKIDSQDKGYVSDLIESAKRFGLIYEKEPGDKNEFGFTSNETRNILFNKTDENQKKYFYSRLGEIIEQLYADNPNSAAAELFYDFNNAGNSTKAKEYEKIIEASKALLYSQRNKYINPLPEIIPENELFLPLSKENMLIAADIIRDICIATVNYIIYPHGHQMRIRSIENVHKKMLDIFSEVEALNIAESEGKIFINNKKQGKELPAFFADSFISYMHDLDIDSITFHKGTEPNELSSLIDVISAHDKSEENSSELLKEKGVTRISVRGINFISSEDKMKNRGNFKDAAFIESLLSKLPSEQKKQDLPSIISAYSEDIAQSLAQLGEQLSQNEKTDRKKEILKAEIINKSIRKIGKELLEKDAPNWPKYKESMAKIISSMEPRLRAEIFSIQPETDDKIDIIKELLLAVADKEAIDIIAEQYSLRDIKKTRNMVQRILSDPERKKSLYPLIKEKLIEMNATEEECELILGDTLSSEEMIHKIIATPLNALAKLLPIIDICALIKGLLSKKSFKQIYEIEEKLIGLTTEENIDIKQLADYFKEILSAYIQDSPDNLLPLFIDTLLKTCQKEERLMPLFCLTTASYLEKITQIFLKTDKIALINQIIRIYTKDTTNIEEYSSALDHTAIKLANAFIEKAEHNLNWRELSESIILLKDKSAKLIFKKALFESGIHKGKDFEMYLIRRNIGKILGQIPKENLSGIITKESFANLQPNEKWNLIEIIWAMENEEMVPFLEVALKDPSVAVRKKVIFYLNKMDGRESAKLLAMALKDENAELREEALNALKSRKDEFAKQALQ